VGDICPFSIFESVERASPAACAALFHRPAAILPERTHPRGEVHRLRRPLPGIAGAREAQEARFILHRRVI
jgi:hypothetical protein